MGAESDSDRSEPREPGLCYRDQTRFLDGEPLFKQSLEMQEKTISADAPVLAALLRNYAQFLGAAGRLLQAAPFEGCAQELEAKRDETSD